MSSYIPSFSLSFLNVSGQKDDLAFSDFIVRDPISASRIGPRDLCVLLHSPDQGAGAG